MGSTNTLGPGQDPTATHTGNGLIVLSRTELYQRIWTTPMACLAREFGISDVALAKLCRRRNIPRPPRGYWARRAAGLHDAPPPLPEPLPRHDKPAAFMRRPAVAVPVASPAPARPKPLPPVGEQKLHPIAHRVRNSLLLSKPSPCGRVLVNEKGLPIVFASPRQATKIAELVNTLVAEAQRKQIDLGSASNAADALEFRRGRNGTVLVIEETLRAPSSSREVRPQEPSGQLAFKLSVEWRQTPDQPVESLIDSVLTHLDEVLR